MRRLLEFGTMMLLLALFMPVQEVFDQWDVPGLSNDSEFAFFAFVLTICLVLLVCKLIAMDILKIGMTSIRQVLQAEMASHSKPDPTFVFLVPPLSLIPLRI